MLELIYHDEHFVAINKPADLLVHRSMIDRHETRFAMQLLRDQIGKRVYALHRLDKPTSGVLLFALSKEAAQTMAAQFKSHMLSKHYLAVVRGFTDEQRLIDHPLKEKLDKICDKQADPNKPAQSARTAYRRLATIELPIALGRYESVRYSLLHVTPQTGRKHQIRRHMKHISHHLIGDSTYGRGEHNRLFRHSFECRRMLLHAQSLEFFHPFAQETIRLVAPLDNAWRGILKRFSWEDALKLEK